MMISDEIILEKGIEFDLYGEKSHVLFVRLLNWTVSP